MGLIVPQTVKVKISNRTCKHYREKGYTFKKFGDIIEVDVFDLPKGSTAKVKIICDVCGKEKEICYGDVVKNNEENKLIICGSDFCINKKIEDTCTKKYGKGIINVFQVEEVKEKIKNTNLERYSCENPMQNEEIRNKEIQTLKEKYGENVINPGQAQDVKDKIKATWKKNYGEDIENPFRVESVKEKSKQTMLNNYGVEHALQNRELLNKVLDSFQFNNTGPCSRAQKYIHFLIGGTLNKHVCNSLVDICFKEEKMAIEYDGSGHFLTDIFNGNKIPTKEALLKEKNREDKIINNGYRMIRFIATKDRIPSDEVILNLIEGFKNSDFKVIRINFEEGTIEKDYNEKSHYDFGELRRITKEDLEQFESEKTINLK